MDLLDRGRSTRDIGRGISWYDVKTLLRYLPHDSNTRRETNPNDVLQGELSTTMAQLMGEVVDSITMLTAVVRGAEGHALEGLPRAMDVWRGVKKKSSETEEEKPEPLSPAQIREMVAARQKKKTN